MLITNKKEFQMRIVKSVPSSNIAIYTLENSEPFSLITFTKRLRSCRNQCISENKDNNKFFGLIILIKCLYGCRNKHVSKNGKNKDPKSQIVTASLAVSTKYLVKYKTTHVMIYSNLSKRTKTPTPVITT